MKTILQLSPRKRQVLDLICREDLSYAEAGQRLGISEHAVKQHMYDAFREMELGSRAAACFRLGQVNPPPVALDFPAARAEQV